MALPLRYELVDLLAEAFRRRGHPYAEAIIAGAPLDLTLAERSAARAAVIVELEAETVVLEHQRALIEAEPDPLMLQARLLNDLDDDAMADVLSTMGADELVQLHQYLRERIGGEE